MRTLLVIFLGLLLIILESPFLGTLDARFYAPDLVLIVIVYMALTRPLLTGAIRAFFLGFLKDGFTSGPFGMYMQISVAMFYVTKLVSMHVSLRGPISLIIYTLSRANAYETSQPVIC